MSDDKAASLREAALHFHEFPRPGKLEVTPMGYDSPMLRLSDKTAANVVASHTTPEATFSCDERPELRRAQAI